MGRGGWSGPAGRAAGRPSGYRPPAPPSGAPVRNVVRGQRIGPVGWPAAAGGVPGGRRWGRIVVRVALVALALLLVGVGFGYYQLEDLAQGMATSQALDGAVTSTDGGVNILVMGLDSRKDQNGQQLPAQILDQLHAGDGQQVGTTPTR